MILTIASGKGGTGKTTLAVNLARSLADSGRPVRLLDCDVEEPDARLFLTDLELTESREVTLPKPIWNPQTCTFCGDCVRACRFNAMALVPGKILIFNELCHACGACSHVCPTTALHEEPKRIGTVSSGHAGSIVFVEGRQEVGETVAPTVVRAARSLAEENSINIIDAAPGTACPVVAALSHADVAVLVTEPTPFGLHDLRLAAHLALQMEVPVGIVINRSDGSDTIITEFAAASHIPVLGRIPFRREYAETCALGDLLVQRFPELRPTFLEIFDQAQRIAALPPPPPPELEKISTVPRTSAAPAAADGTASVKEIIVLSGKGGTGKTTLTAALAELLNEPLVLADCDVDAADLHLLRKPRVIERHAFSGGASARIDPEKCTSCGICAAACHFDAITDDGPPNDAVDSTYRVDDESCEGCGLCSLVCPVQAITMETRSTGEWYLSETDRGPMIHARLGIGEENSGKLVTQVRHRASETAGGAGPARILGDGPPGTSCPAIASVTGADLALIVTEPTISGVHDLRRILDLTRNFSVPSLLVINKVDINSEMADAARALAREYHAEILGEIPYDPLVQTALAKGRSILAFPQAPAAGAIRRIAEKLERLASPLPSAKTGNSGK